MPENRSPLEGRYANSFEIGYTAHEFLLDFAQSYDDEKWPGPHTRIITAAQYARVLLDLLAHSLSEYERDYGPLPPAGTPEGSA